MVVELTCTAQRMTCSHTNNVLNCWIGLNNILSIFTSAAVASYLQLLESSNLDFKHFGF